MLVTKKGKEGVKGGAFRSDTPNAPIPRNDLKKKNTVEIGGVVQGEARQASRHSHVSVRQG
jgi:hypothetical protein